MTHEPPTGWEAGGHPGIERLADHEEGLLNADESAEVDAHLAGCTQCQQQRSLLTRARAALGALPAEAMPATIAARLDAAIADAGGSASSTTIVPLNAGRRRWRVHPTAAGLGAAAAVAALVAALVVGHGSGGRSSTKPEQTSALGAAAADSTLSNLSPTTSGTDYTAGNLASTVPALVAGPQGPAPFAATAQAPAASGGAAPNHRAGPNAKAGATTAAPTVPPELSRLFNSPSALRSCVEGVEAGGPTVRPLAIDFAHYQGAPAVLIVLPGLSAGNVDAWFVGPDCGAADASLLGYKAIRESASASPSPAR